MKPTPALATLLMAALVASISNPASADPKPKIQFDNQPGQLAITIGNHPLATYVYHDNDTLRPYFKDVYAPGGHRLTRNHPPQPGDPDDHATYHPGVFWAFGDISGSDFWRNRAHVVHEKFVRDPKGGPGSGTFAVQNKYVTKDGQLVCREFCRITFLVRPAGTLMLWDSYFKSKVGDFYFGDQEEMGLGVRLHTPLIVEADDKEYDGRILNSHGHRDGKGTWGKIAKWCDYGGKLDGKFVGVTLMPDPSNFRPSWFHARDYGLLVANPFGSNAFTEGEKSKIVVKKGQAFHMGFGILLHAGAREGSVDLDAAYQDYLTANANKTSLRSDLRGQPGLVAAEFLYDAASFPSCHASTIAETKKGLVAAFFGGTGEGDDDVGIWVCRKARGSEQWTPPAEVANGVVKADERYPCWNPVLFQPANGPLLLFYKVGPSPKAWWGMLTRSYDQGQTWSESVRLPDTILGPIKNKPVMLEDKTLLCGSSTEHDGWRVHFERSRDLGQTWARTEAINDGSVFGAIQPTILFHPGGRLQALCRNRKDPRVMGETWSSDGGKTWTPMTQGPLPNPNAGFDGVTLTDGRQLLVYNHSKRGRSKLNVAVSRDGKDWKAALLLEDRVTIGGLPAYGAYPGVIQTSDGRVHVVYTWKRDLINHVVIDPDKLALRDMPGGQWPEEAP